MRVYQYTLNRSRFMEVDTGKNDTVSLGELHMFLLWDMTEEQIQ